MNFGERRRRKKKPQTFSLSLSLSLSFLFVLNLALTVIPRIPPMHMSTVTVPSSLEPWSFFRARRRSCCCGVFVFRFRFFRG